MIAPFLDMLLALAITSQIAALDVCRLDDSRSALAIRFERLIMDSPTLRRQQ